ncbi:E3 ubiquitin-protein ligase MARCH2-like [Actinia tenebrosa]|uniref:E3 ubiquitin-protein ligase MARCH2-like n=1 Tax=Actinia tenebrosa TaxID=6105 RepID=A0A6P8IZI1_ACTTE|nr:E3 ubiquitin-protein ligase MARCH2-like [Actinia tenebrosa]
MAEALPSVEQPSDKPKSNGLKTNVPFTEIPLNHNADAHDEPFCRICHETGGKRGHQRLIQPCLCSGTLGNVHRACIERWLTVTKTNKCTICEFQYKTKMVLKPFNQWMWPPFTTENIVITIISILIHLTVLIQLFCLVFICLQLYHDKFPTALGVAITGLVTGMPWTVFIAFALDFGIIYSDYLKVWKASNERVKLIVDDLKFYHDLNTLQ